MATAKKIFQAEQFTATKWNTAEDKAKFANQFVKFIQSDFELDKFPYWFYNKLSGMFGHIAHCNQQGFYSSFFENIYGKLHFIQMTLNYGCWGDAAWTYSDVELALKKWMKDSDLLERLTAIKDGEIYDKTKRDVIWGLEQLTADDIQEIIEQYTVKYFHC